MNHEIALKNQTGSVVNPGVSAYLAKLSERLSIDDLQVIKHKYEDSRIESMSDAEILSKTANCIKRIHIITGWNLPDDVGYIKILTDEFFKKLKEDFYMLNFSEISFAFRKNGMGIKDWGKNMNLDLVCNVLGSYCDERERLSHEEERVVEKLEQKIYTDEEIKNMRRCEIEAAFQAMKKGYYPIIHIYFEEILREDNIFKEEENINEFFVRILNSGVENLYVRNE